MIYTHINLQWHAEKTTDNIFYEMQSIRDQIDEVIDRNKLYTWTGFSSRVARYQPMIQ